MTQAAPTSETYDALQAAFDHFNATLFSGRLHRPLITLTRKSGTFGYFSPKRFLSLLDANGFASDDTNPLRSNNAIGSAHEIALNPCTFVGRTNEEILSTLVHEMVHQDIEVNGKASRAGYHSAEWARRMVDVGLTPSDTGKPGGKPTGQKVSHYISEDGPFSKECKILLSTGWVLSWTDTPVIPKTKKARESKTKYTCPRCGEILSGGAGLRIRCDECNQRMLVDGESPDEDNSTSRIPDDENEQPVTANTQGTPAVEPSPQVLSSLLGADADDLSFLARTFVKHMGLVRYIRDGEECYEFSGLDDLDSDDPDVSFAMEILFQMALVAGIREEDMAVDFMFGKNHEVRV